MDDNPTPIDLYMRKHGHYPRARLQNGGVQRVELSIAPGYVEISTYPYGARLVILGSTFRRLIKWAVPVLKMQGPDFDQPTAIAEAIKFEDELKREQRQFKKTLYGRGRRRR